MRSTATFTETMNLRSRVRQGPLDMVDEIRQWRRVEDAINRAAYESMLDYFHGPRYGPPFPKVYGPPEPEFCACKSCQGHPHGQSPDSW